MRIYISSRVHEFSRLAWLVLAVCGATHASAEGAASNSALLGGDAFSMSRGVVAVNQAAGSGNLQRNTVQVGQTLQVMASADAGLGIRPGGSPAPTPAGNVATRNVVSMALGAFQHSRGVVQLSQVAGNANTTTNSISISIAP